MKDYQANSLARIKLWLDIPFYMQYLEDENDLDELILMSGIDEDSVKDKFSNKTNDLGSINPSIMSEINWYHKDIKYVPDGKGGRIEKETIMYHYDVPKKICVPLLRAILNRYNPDLAKNGYIFYATNDETGDFYVKLDDVYSLYIDFHAYMTGDNDTVNKRILFGLKNITECSKTLKDIDYKKAVRSLRMSSIYKKILKL